jgi:hypothetical protein
VYQSTRYLAVTFHHPPKLYQSNRYLPLFTGHRIHSMCTTQADTDLCYSPPIHHKCVQINLFTNPSINLMCTKQPNNSAVQKAPNQCPCSATVLRNIYLFLDNFPPLGTQSVLQRPYQSWKKLHAAHAVRADIFSELRTS